MLGASAGVTLLSTDRALAQPPAVSKWGPVRDTRTGLFRVPDSSRVAPHYLRCATYFPLVNSGFVIAGAASVRLIEVNCPGLAPGARPSPTATYERFSLIFMGAASRPLPQRIYTVSHRTIGRFSLFLVPIGRKDRRGVVYYEAVINRPNLDLTQTLKNPS